MDKTRGCAIHITLNKEYLYKLRLFIGKLEMVKALDILPYHDMAKPKYAELGIDYPLKDIKPATKEMAIAAKKIVLQGFKESRIELLKEKTGGNKDGSKCKTD